MIFLKDRFFAEPMKFCTECKTALSLFDFHENELCNDCLSKKNKNETANKNEKSPDRQQSIYDLSDCILSCEDDKIVLRTTEGMMLWSSPVGDKNKLGTILDRAQRILEIRKKRKQN
jgi:hypothetical protein